MKAADIVRAIGASVEFYDRMRLEYTPRTCLGLATSYLVRKAKVLSYYQAQQALEARLAERSKGES